MFNSNGISSSLNSSTITPKAQFKAVIFCGYGQDLFPLIINNLDSHTEMGNKLEERGTQIGQIKCLLPLSGKVMIDFILDKVDEAGIYGQYSIHSHCYHSCKIILLMPLV